MRPHPTVLSTAVALGSWYDPGGRIFCWCAMMFDRACDSLQPPRAACGAAVNQVTCLGKLSEKLMQRQTTWVFSLVYVPKEPLHAWWPASPVAPPILANPAYGVIWLFCEMLSPLLLLPVHQECV